MQKGYQIVGVLNVTPDSYFDGGKYDALDAAVARVGELLSEGADIIDVGGESTIPSGPGGVTVEEELERTIPVIQAIKNAHPDAQLSIDTYKAEVARQAIEAGANMVNDVSAGRNDPDMFSLLSTTDVHVVLMHAKHPPPNVEIENTQYHDVVTEVYDFLAERLDAAVTSGIARERIILDPGLGFFLSSDARYSFQMLQNLSKLTELGCPIYVSPSRKSFLAGPEKLPPEDRLPGTIASSIEAVRNGATYIRTHDVAEVRRALETAALLRSGDPQ